MGPFRVIRTMLLFHIFFNIIFFNSQQVNTKDGPINGIAQKTISGKTYYAFYSIPYAKPPVGTRRYQPPELTDPWTEPYDGRVEKPIICYQVWSDSEQENEDCLYMNVFTPVDPSEAVNSSLPVMVNIHGGGFIAGSGLESGGFSPKYLIEEDILVVSFNYRLGAFGFLSTGDDIIPGNLGLKDQILALKWVQRNIAAFGGDSTKVTISGQSAGAASVGYLVISPAAKGLFAGAILESGTSLCPWAYQRNQTKNTFKTDVSGADAVYQLSTQQGFIYAPVIEDTSNDSAISQFQYESLTQGNINKVPILIGVCSEEGLMNLDDNIDFTMNSYDTQPGYLVPQDLHIDYGTKEWNEVGNLIKQEYSPLSTFANNKAAGIKYFTEHDFVKAATKFAELASTFTDVYFYQFSYSGPIGFNTNHKYPGTGNVTHVEEWGYLYWGYSISEFPSEDQLMHNRMVALFTNFVKFQVPTPAKDPLFDNIVWPKVTNETFQYLNIGNFSDITLSVVNEKPKADRMTFWDNIYEKYGLSPFDTY
ncbi:hypothetical protein ABEB36_005962 [Hypothenemus hampei]|uniref:Carboxylic ester hydrolase n=1 Tax=Hypothenemus hampei TaxID=57062 RepID=A0ABD1F011_HYPHA